MLQLIKEIKMPLLKNRIDVYKMAFKNNIYTQNDIQGYKHTFEFIKLYVNDQLK